MYFFKNSKKINLKKIEICTFLKIQNEIEFWKI